MPHMLRARPSSFVARLIGITVVLLVSLAGCTSPGSPTVSSPTTTRSSVEATQPPATPTIPEGAACATGRLTIGDLPKLDSEWQQGLAAETKIAQAWRDDVKLTSFRVGCALLEAGFRWQTTFYSPSAQAFFSTDTGVVEPAEYDPSDIPELSMDNLSFGLLRRSLSKAGYGDTLELSPATGVDVRMNTDAMPFGPPDAPKGTPLFHVAVIYRGEIRDLFVNAIDGTVYRYSF
ncbi:MAG TPA: hypothetical protein VFL82_08410 [Thermomicrobiales bacterium]|nr:hypothetical protein [Thermomicrobiales bacterium]